jgi:hypothetical protein
MKIDILLHKIRAGFLNIQDHRGHNSTYSLADLLSAAFAMFSLKDPSLLHFRNEYPHRSANLKRIYSIQDIPKDTALREGIDGVAPDDLRQLFNIPLQTLHQHGVFEEREVLGGYNVISFDGTGHFCSTRKSCPQCMVKNHRNGTVHYHHQALAAVAVHPGQATVFPVDCEAIVRQDGSTKNDCERNAAKRLIPSVRKKLPNMKLLAVCDALYTNGPYIRLLTTHDIRYIIGIKEGFILTEIPQLKEQNKLTTVSWQNKNLQCTAQFINGLMLNGQHQDIFVNFVEYTETDSQTGKRKFYHTWITDIPVTKNNVCEVVSAGRARWKIENETFNTLKNQGYHLDHSFGHGKKYLTTNFAVLTMLAFLSDQVTQHLDIDFQKAWKQCKTNPAVIAGGKRYVRYLICYQLYL